MRQPLADRLRPRDFSDFVGQTHIVNLIKNMEEPRNMIFYGPSGTGKTSLARIVASKSDMEFKSINATNAGTADIKAVKKLSEERPVLLYLDEIQAFNKKQQQSLLEMTEDGSVVLIAATTENPMFYVINALLSRCSVFEFKPLGQDDVYGIVTNAFLQLARDQNVRINVDEDTLKYIVHASGGDVRKALTAVETLMDGTLAINQTKAIELSTARNLLQATITTYDPTDDKHYDLISAFQKSMRGSDVDASLYYLARLLTVGDLPIICRRLLVTACEDVGLAYPSIIPIVKSCIDAAMFVGLPEAQLPLADAVALVALSPKSNSGHDAIKAAMDFIANNGEHPVPRNLQNKHYDDDTVEDPGQHYLYPHAFPGHWVNQQYLPDALFGVTFYEPGRNATEQGYRQYWEKLYASVEPKEPDDE